jgi:multiple sugar transport system permease protein
VSVETPRRSITNSQALNDRLAYIMLAPGIVFLIAVVVLPTLFAVYISTTIWNLTGVQGVFIGMRNYQQMVHDPRFISALWRSIYFTIASVSIELLLGLTLALGLSKIRRGQDTLLSIFIIPMAITSAAVAYVFKFLLDPEIGLVNYILTGLGFDSIAFLGSTRWALNSVILTDVWQWTPLMTLIIFAGLEALPEEPFEAARIDGATTWQRFKWVTLPLLKPVISIAVLIRGMDAFRAFTKVFIMTNGGPGRASEVLSLYAYRLGFSRFNIGYATAVSMIMLFVIIMAAWTYVQTTGILKKDST